MVMLHCLEQLSHDVVGMVISSSITLTNVQGVLGSAGISGSVVDHLLQWYVKK